MIRNTTMGETLILLTRAYLPPLSVPKIPPLRTTPSHLNALANGAFTIILHLTERQLTRKLNYKKNYLLKHRKYLAVMNYPKRSIVNHLMLDQMCPFTSTAALETLRANLKKSCPGRILRQPPHWTTRELTWRTPTILYSFVISPCRLLLEV